MAATPIIRFVGVHKQYDSEHVALEHLDLEIYNGEFLTLLGPSGCGKTTLLRLLSGFDDPDRGQIFIQEQSVSNLPPEQRHINMVFQSYALFPHMSAFDNVAFGLRCQGVAKAEIEQRVREALMRVKLEKLAHRKPHTLSGGQQQRVAIARAVVNEPLVLLLDEPLSALDYHLRQNMRIELKALQRRLGITFIFVTHDQEEALSLSDRVVVMNHGVIEQIGTPREIYEQPRNLFVANFIGTANIFSTTVKQANATDMIVEIAGTACHLKNKHQFKQGECVNIVVRPEDVEVWGKTELASAENVLPATVSEVIYKGSTVDLIVTLTDGQAMAATEFFDEDDEELLYEIGEKVLVRWKTGWEVFVK